MNSASNTTLASQSELTHTAKEVLSTSVNTVALMLWWLQNRSVCSDNRGTEEGLQRCILPSLPANHSWPAM